MLSRVFKNNETEFIGHIGLKHDHSLEHVIKRSPHAFDSAHGRNGGNGFYFHYSNSVDRVIGYRVTNVLLDGLLAPHNGDPVFYILSSLSRASYAGHRNGLPQSIISVVTSPAVSGRVNVYYPAAEIIWVETEELRDIYIELQSHDNTPLPQYRFVVVIEFIHLFK